MRYFVCNEKPFVVDLTEEQVAEIRCQGVAVVQASKYDELKASMAMFAQAIKEFVRTIGDEG